MTAANSRVGALIALTERLTGLMTHENELLEVRQPREIQNTLEEKGRLTNAYNAELSTLKSNPSLLKEALPTELLAFKEATRRFREVVEANRAKLQAVRNVSEGMLQAIGKELAKDNKPVDRYDNKAMVKPVSANWEVARPTTLAINQMV